MQPMTAEASILVVEDDESARTSLVELLEDRGYRLADAANGQEALEYLRRHEPPDLILLDLMMPVMDGWRFRAEQQKDPALADIPVIVMSATENIAQRLRQLDAAAFVRKPFDLAHLLDVIRSQTDTVLQSEARRAALLQAPDAVITFDEATTVTEWNPAAERIFGYDAETAVGRRLCDLIVPPQARDSFLADFEWAMEGGETVPLDRQVEVTVRRADGSEFPVEQLITRVPSGGAPLFTGFFKDVSGRKSAERARKASEECLSLFVEHTPAAVAMLDRDMRYLVTSRRWLVDYRLGDQDVIGRSHYEVFPETPERWKEVHQRCLSGGVELSAEEPFPRADGSLDWVRREIRPWCDERGEIGGIIIFSEVITERKLAQDALRRANEELERHVAERTAALMEANRGLLKEISERKQLEEQLIQAQKMEAIGRLAGGVAHEFNNLLAVILGYADLVLLDTSDADPRRLGLEQIRKASERASTITQQILTFSRRQIVTMQVMDLNESVSSMDKMLRRLIGEDLELSTSLDPDPGFVRADPTQLTQVLMNLAVNARDAMPQGGRLRIRTFGLCLDDDSPDRPPELKPGRYAGLEVRDSGCGIDPAAMPHIFEPFFTTKDPGMGTGLGLSTVYGIVKQCDGHVEVSSTLGTGTTFRILLPVVEQPAPGAPGAEAERVPLPGSGTILLVEDEAMVRQLARHVLELNGYAVLEASGGTQAVRICERHEGPIDLVITDVVMPGMNGREVAEQVARVRPEARMLFMSGYTDDVIVQRGVLANETPFLQKPFTPALLAARVREVLTGAAQPASG